MQRPRIFSSFSFLNGTQFLGALNDNIFKLVIAFLLIGVVGKEHSNTVLWTVGLAFVVPFLLFSIPAGTLADRHSKRNITVATKALEVVTMSLGVVAFWATSVWGSYLVLFLMATQSAVFGPSKYGIIPELVRKDQIASANGILAALTVLATIVGTFLASFLSQITGRNYMFIAFFCVGISIAGLICALLIEKTPPAGSERKMSAKLIKEVWRVLVRSRTENYLFASILGTSYFYLMGAFVQLNVITFGIQSLGLSDIGGGYLFLVCAGGIAIGAFVAGVISGKQVELGVAPLAGLGIILCLFALMAWQYSLFVVVGALFALGLCGGLFLVPFDAYIQVASPLEQRGENVAAGNFLSFVGVLIATALLALFGFLGFTAAQGFGWMALLTAVVAIILSIRLCDTYVRLVSRLLYRKGKGHVEVAGRDLLPSDRPSVILCDTPYWKIGLWAMSTMQQRYMKFLIEKPETLTKKQWWLLRMAKAELFEGAPYGGATTAAKRWLRRGYSVTIIPKPDRNEEQEEHLLISAVKIMAGEGAALAKAELTLPEGLEPHPHSPHVDATVTIIKS